MSNVLDPHGPAAAALARYGWIVLVMFLVVTLAMWALIAWIAFRRRGSLDTHAPITEGGGIRWILVGGLGFPAAVLVGVFIGMLTELNALPLDHHQGHGSPHVRITGHRWWWDVEYRMGSVDQWVRSASELHIPTGTPIDVELTSDDVIHSFWVPSLHGKVDLLPATSTRIEIQATDSAVYAGECAEFCGKQHANMLFRVVAEPPDRFEQFLASERQEGVLPASDSARRGLQLFTEHACILCHTIRGTTARGSVGPDLTHVGRRLTLAGPIHNDPASMRAWVSHAQSIKPGVTMPNMLDLTSGDLAALSDYLMSLQ